MGQESNGKRTKASEFVRPVGATEHWIGVGILASVVLLCAWVLYRGRTGDTMQTLPTAGAEKVVAAVAPVKSAEAAPTAPKPAPKPAAGPSALPLTPPDKWQAGKVEKFDEKGLFEKVDGKAESYLAFGFVAMENQNFMPPGAKKGEESSSHTDGVDVFIYDMGTPLQAYGMFTSERNEGEPLAVGQDGYLAAGSVFFRAGRYYVNVLAEKEDYAPQAKTLAEQLAGKLPKEKFEAPGAAWFPTENLVASAVGWRMKNAMAQEWLSDVYVAKYKFGEAEAEAFLAKRDSEAKVKSDLAQWRKNLAGSGRVADVKVNGVAMVLEDDSKKGAGPWSFAFAAGKAWGGVNGIADRKQGEALASKLYAAAGKIQ